MRKNIIPMSIIGMLLLSSFIITPISAEDEMFIISDPEPADNLENVDIYQQTVSAYISYNGVSGGTDPGSFYWEIGGEYVITNSSTKDVQGRKDAELKVPLPLNTDISWYVYVIDIKGNELNKTFTFKTTEQSEPPIITINITDPTPVNESDEISIDYELVSVYVEVEIRYPRPIIPQYLPFNYTISGDNISTTSGYSSYPDTITADILGPLQNNTIINWSVNINASAYGEKFYKNVTFWFKTFNNRPVAEFTNTTHGLKVDFDGTLSYDSDGKIANYTWYFGDGSKGYGNKTQHIFGGNGTYLVSLNVTDDGGKSDNKTVPVTVKNDVDNIPPTIQIIQPARAFYIGNTKIRPLLFRMALVIGTITIKVDASDSGSGIAKVEFYINNKLVNTSYEPNEDGLYTYKWTRDRIRLIHLFKITVVAYDRAEPSNNATTKPMFVRKYL